jgi:hypothetical protein
LPTPGKGKGQSYAWEALRKENIKIKIPKIPKIVAYLSCFAGCTHFAQTNILVLHTLTRSVSLYSIVTVGVFIT